MAPLAPACPHGFMEYDTGHAINSANNCFLIMYPPKEKSRTHEGILLIQVSFRFIYIYLSGSISPGKREKYVFL
jgi:hypothetical protein